MVVREDTACQGEVGRLIVEQFLREGAAELRKVASAPTIETATYIQTHTHTHTHTHVHIQIHVWYVYIFYVQYMYTLHVTKTYTHGYNCTCEVGSGQAVKRYMKDKIVYYI